MNATKPMIELDSVLEFVTLHPPIIDSKGIPIMPQIYVASRASIPELPAMWRALRDNGWNISSSWIDEAAEGETDCMTELWQRIEHEISISVGVLLYVRPEDFPLKGALIECGIALGMQKPVALVMPGIVLEHPSRRPLGSWSAHPKVKQFETLDMARDWLLEHRPVA